MSQQNNNPTPIPFGNPQLHSGVEIITHARKLHMYPVTDDELNSLKEFGLSATIDLGLFALCTGGLITLLVTLSTVEFKDPKLFAAYVASMVVSAVGTIFFGGRTFVAYRGAKAKLQQIKGKDD